ncbi:MAG: aspartate 1-decarboxylase [Acidobacteriota bacterium]|nr:aspartate 1-decarboxylase [Acidobacteriota bacterium]
MRRTMLKSKLMKAVVTAADLEYEGSLGIDAGLIEAADILPFEKVHIYNLTNGERFSTYVIKEPAGSGRIAVYGAAAHKAGVGDTIIIVSYAQLEEDEISFFRPKIVLLAGSNRIQSLK